MWRFAARLGALALVAVLTVVWPLAADEGDQERDHQRDAVRGAVERGEIKSLVEVLQAVRPKLPGEIVGVEIESDDGIWVYEFRVADDKGRLFEVYVAAATARILKIEEK